VCVELLLGGKKHPNIDLHAEGVRYVGNVPFHQMPTILAACNLIAIPYRRSLFMDAGASNKIAEALACYRPIVATRTPNLIANFPLLAKELEGRLAEPGNIDEIAQVILVQLREPKLGSIPVDWDWGSIAQKAAIALALVKEGEEVKE
jgi:glycosyltransferase involved in cell wall biosynthesis